MRDQAFAILLFAFFLAASLLLERMSSQEAKDEEHAAAVAWAQSWFDVPISDRAAYGVTPYGPNELALSFDAAKLNPDVVRNPKLRGSDLPRSALLIRGVPQLDARYVEREGIAACGGALRGVFIHPSYGIETPQMEFEGLEVDQEQEGVSVYGSPDRDWFASCLRGLTCRNIFLNDGWMTARLIVPEADLCKSRAMNERLRKIVDLWVPTSRR